MKLRGTQVFGIYILIIGLSILLKVLFPPFKIIYLFLIVLICVSVHIIIQSIIVKSRKKMIIPGTTVLMISVYILLSMLFFDSFLRFDKIWPIICGFPALSLVIYYLISEKKSPATIIPGIFISLMSTVLFLIVNDILKLEFVDFLLMLIASMIIVIGLFLIFSIKRKKRDTK